MSDQQRFFSDVSELAAVINYELPNVPETYVHRIGRTGRAGRSGIAISFCNFDELAYLKDIEKLTRKKIPVVEDHPWPMEIFELTPKKQREPRPPRVQRQQPAAGREKTIQAPETPKQPKPVQTLKSTPKAVKPPPKPEPPTAKAPARQVRPAKPSRPAVKDDEPVIIKIEHPKAVYPPLPPKPVLRKISSEPPRMGRLVAFADGRSRGGRGNTPRKRNSSQKSGKE